MGKGSIMRGRVSAYPSEKEKGMVEVQVGGFDPEHDTVYAKVEQSLSGIYWLPEIGDIVEVEVPDQPGYEARIIHIHRRQQDPQTEACWSEKNDVKQFMTRSGHLLTFNDVPDKGFLMLHSAGGLEISMEDQSQQVTLRKAEQETPMVTLNFEKDSITLEAGSSLSISCGGTTISIDDGGNLSISAKGKIQISGQEIDLQGKTKLTGKAQQLELTGDVGAKLSGQSQLEVSSSGMTQVKGSMVKLN